MTYNIDNSAQQRFEIYEGGHVVYATYRRDDATLYINHVVAAPQLRGTGAAGRLMQGVVDHAAAEGFVVVPICSYAVAWMQRHVTA